MYQRISLKLSVFLILVAGLAVKASAFAQDLTPLRACARALSVNIEGDRFNEGFPSDDDDSMYFVSCDDNSKLGRDHYIVTTQGTYHLFEKAHNDYKGGMEPTHYRFILENKTFYFKSNIVGEMGDVFDDKGINLSKSALGTRKIDVSSKNPVLAYYMKTLTGRTDPKAALITVPVNPERTEKAQACLRHQLGHLGSVLYRSYLARFRDIEIDPDTLLKYRETAVKALSNPGCRTDSELTSKFDPFLANLP